jgi:hypothetical protein
MNSCTGAPSKFAESAQTSVVCGSPKLKQTFMKDVGYTGDYRLIKKYMLTCAVAHGCSFLNRQLCMGRWG